MNREIAHTNISFNFLSSSSEFLNLILSDLSCCILLLNERMELQAYNDPLKTIFSNKKDENLLYRRCGEAIGCAFQVDSAEDCGKTDHCCNCELRLAAMNSYLNNAHVFKQHVVRPYYTQNNERVNKHLQFSTRLFKFHKEKYVVMMIEDVSMYFEEKAQKEE